MLKHMRDEIALLKKGKRLTAEQRAECIRLGEELLSAVERDAEREEAQDLSGSEAIGEVVLTPIGTLEVPQGTLQRCRHQLPPERFRIVTRGWNGNEPPERLPKQDESGGGVSAGENVPVSQVANACSIAEEELFSGDPTKWKQLSQYSFTWRLPNGSLVQINDPVEERILLGDPAVPKPTGLLKVGKDGSVVSKSSEAKVEAEIEPEIRQEAALTAPQPPANLNPFYAKDARGSW